MAYGRKVDSAQILRKLAGMRPVDVLARLVWGEARGELLKGQVAVACVVLNRVADGRWGGRGGIVSVCLKPWQFSCFNSNDPNLPLLLQPPKFSPFEQCELVAQLAVDGLLVDPTGGATHYFNPSVVPGRWPASWDKAKMAARGQIGRHSFWLELH